MSGILKWGWPGGVCGRNKIRVTLLLATYCILTEVVIVYA